MTFARGRAGVLAASVLLAALGCGTEPALSGSAGELFSLQVSRVEVMRNDEALQVTYYNNRGVDLDVVVRISVSLKDVEVVPGVNIPLGGEYTPGHPRTTVAHAPGGEPVRLFPRVKKGDMNITGGGNPGELTSGNFSMLFESSGGDLGGGRTLAGKFDAVAKDAGFGPAPDAGSWDAGP
ncbi:MAG: hypothetical protein ACYC8T_16620 [Myxococcaceae bacterium]